MGSITVTLGQTPSDGFTQYQVYSDGTCDYRRGVRNCKDVLDVALTATGFDGIENTDWENLIENE